MDLASDENLKDAKAKREYVFGGVRNALDNQVAKNVSREAARQFENHLQENTFFFAHLDPRKYPSKDESVVARFEKNLGKQLVDLVNGIATRTHPDLRLPAYPKYSMHSLGIAVREGSQAFIEGWEARLGFKRVEGLSTAPWQSIKALSRRYAEGWWDGYKLSPIDNLSTVMRNVLSKFLDNPMDWSKTATDEEKAAAVNRIKNEVTDEALSKLAKQRLRELPLADWQTAYGLRGTGSTNERKHRVWGIFHVQVPIPESVSDRLAQAWIEIFEKLISEAVERLKQQVEGR